ncbi:MAG TPA: peptidoglycan bridge formation glycyltransferase FemA/FemB family protein [Pseudonocardiaceae bacterium]|nr:peptidoglycan bridge formation glycyltransferase FemA/FemB family protein [Pseudonocardiaceae bacterium]
MSSKPGEISVTLCARPDPDTIRAWDHLVSHTPGSDVAQLSAWSAVRRQADFVPRYVLARRAGQLVGGALVLQRRLPVLGVVGYVPHGPVIASGAGRVAVAPVVSIALAGLGRRYLSGLFVQPPDRADDISGHLLRLGFRPSAAGIAPAASIRIDLTRDVEDLRNGLNSSNRRRTRTGADRGVAVRLGAERDLPVVADLLASTAAHQQFDAPSLDYLRTLYRELDRGDHVQIFIAELGGVPVVAELFTGCGGVLTSRLTGMQRDDPVKKSGAAAAVIWSAILWAKANGYHTFDFGGIPVDAVDMIRDGEAGHISRLAGPEVFKASFGGEPFRYPPAVELLSSRLLRTGYDLFRRSEVGGKLVATARRLMQGRASI